MKQYKSRDKITQKMTRDGLIEVNETQQTAERISKREQDADFKSPRSSKRRRTDAASRCSVPNFPVTPRAGSCPRKGHRHRRARHGAYRSSADPQSQ